MTRGSTKYIRWSVQGGKGERGGGGAYLLGGSAPLPHSRLCSLDVSMPQCLWAPHLFLHLHLCCLSVCALCLGPLSSTALSGFGLSTGCPLGSTLCRDRNRSIPPHTIICKAFMSFFWTLCSTRSSFQRDCQLNWGEGGGGGFAYFSKYVKGGGRGGERGGGGVLITIAPNQEHRVHCMQSLKNSLQNVISYKHTKNQWPTAALSI